MLQAKADRLMDMADLVTPMAIRAAVEIGLPEYVDKGPATAAEAAFDLAVDPRALRKLLAHLDALGIVQVDSTGRYRLAEFGEPLLARCDSLGVRPRLDPSHISGRSELALFGLAHTVRTGAASYEAVHGESLWNDLEGPAGELEGISVLEHAEPAFDAELVVDALDWSAVSSVIDVGGNNGALLQKILETYPHLRGTLVDLGRSVEVAHRRFEREGLAGRTEAIAGSFFDPLPKGADVYLLSAVLADWSDADCVKILRRCAEAASQGALVVLAEVHMRPPVAGGEQTRSRADLWLEASMTHPDRTVADLEQLAYEAGLRVWRSGPHSACRSILLLKSSGGESPS